MEPWSAWLVASNGIHSDQDVKNKLVYEGYKISNL